MKKNPTLAVAPVPGVVGAVGDGLSRRPERASTRRQLVWWPDVLERALDVRTHGRKRRSA